MQDEVEIAIGKRFLSRRDVKAVQFPDGHYEPNRTKWTMDDFRRHVAGDVSLGHYMVGQDGMTKLFAFDLDLINKPGYYISFDENILDPVEANPREGWTTPNHPGIPFWTLQLRCQAEALGMKVMALGAADHVAISYSGGKGLHVYCFFNEPQPAADARKLSVEVLKAVNRHDFRPAYRPVRGDNFWQSTADKAPNIEIELFPKQDAVQDLGNLMRLPLGINRKTGQKSYFLDCRFPYTELHMMDPLEALGSELPWD